MLLWLEEASIEIAMILATALGLFMFVAAVASLVVERLRLREQRRERAATLDTAAPARYPSRITGDHM
jgi:hypothetical protein